MLQFEKEFCFWTNKFLLEMKGANLILNNNIIIVSCHSTLFIYVI